MTKRLSDIPLSVLDLAPVVAGGTISQSFKNSLDLAQHVEKWGFHRYWLAEHHNMPGIASSATSVVIGYIAAGTSKIRVGSGGIMLPNHAPLVIAEQFGTLESMYPGRIDLGLGRAPGTDQLTAQALRRQLRSDGHDFPELLEELQGFFNPGPEIKRVRAYPGEGLDVPIWLLGSSGFSAQLAAELGLPFAFASHFSPDHTIPAIELYQRRFKPSDSLEKPYAMVCVNVIAADTTERAKWLFTSIQQQFLNLVRNRPSLLSPPIDNIEDLWSPFERSAIEQQLRTSIVGDKETVKEKLEIFLSETGADEIMINSHIYHQEDRLRSFEIISELIDEQRKGN
ncbi:LLM class flavin-dependent oxidoreductase [Bacillus sp. 31A1R]|uniref:LLM class flavin-dependent oxidoreductase n=1 Tax=Robertmurraya mangrovi TaxID=3098077 RepID=A0ABU5J3J5_9BACI|nr:LLM class flavin-dependent oxidoreductase [Bacillus sp. 31A1R]MDZ5473911.1 LLM class flavin-dependent oxidoreductase [Bacillus sp. 31A1R]